MFKMTPDEYAGILQMVVPNVIDEYIKKRDVTWEVALKSLYQSSLYEALEDKETSIWHLSPVLLCDLLIEEIETGNITWPEEQSA
jgi:hypothetical protein